MKKVILLLLTMGFAVACSNDEDPKVVDDGPTATSHWEADGMKSLITFYDNNTARVRNADIDLVGEVTTNEVDGAQYLVISLVQDSNHRISFIISPATLTLRLEEITVTERYLAGDVTEKEFTRVYYQRFEI